VVLGAKLDHVAAVFLLVLVKRQRRTSWTFAPTQPMQR
jgi:hypothetical protein